MTPLLSASPDALQAWFTRQGHPAYRARQVERWIYQAQVAGFDEMTDLPRDLRTELARDFVLWTSHIESHRVAEDGTEKLLLGFPEGGTIECVLLRDAARRTVCISTQVGCAMGCVFCASGLSGVDRNLTSDEILEQLLRLSRLLPPNERLSHIVVMGMGEPLANLDQLLPALDRACQPEGMGISVRRITISTVGIPRAMDRLIELGSRYHLAVSLHAPHDALRNELVPINRKTGLQAVLAAADRYFAASGRRLTFEYVLMADVNDRPEHARQLVTLLRGRTTLLNVIPYNPVAGLPYRTPSRATQRQFRDILRQRGINVQFRQRKGDSIDAACGQLRRRFEL